MKPRYSRNVETISTRHHLARESRPSVLGNKGTKFELATTINATPEELFAFWRNFENLPRVMEHVESVRCIENESLWRVRNDSEKTVEWKASVINERPNEMIAWRTLEGSDVQHAGSIWFTPAPGGLGTEVKLSVEYDAGAFTDMLAKLFRRSPKQQAHEDLRHFKQLVEAGEIATTLGQSAGRAEDKSEKYQEAK